MSRSKKNLYDIFISVLLADYKNIRYKLIKELEDFGIDMDEYKN